MTTDELEERVALLEERLKSLGGSQGWDEGTLPHGHAHDYGSGDEIAFGLYANGAIQPRMTSLDLSSDFGVTQTALTRKHNLTIGPHTAAADPHTGYVLESVMSAAGDMYVATGDNVPALFAAPTTTGHVLTADTAVSQKMKWAAASSMLKTANTGYFFIPAGPSVGTAVTNGIANTYGTYTELIASTSEALYIVGWTVARATISSTATYLAIMFGTGAATETDRGEDRVGLTTWTNAGITTGVTFQKSVLPFPIPVAASTRIAVKLASAEASVAWNIALICINQDDLAGI